MPELRFLVVRLGSLGDIVHTFPAVAALRDSFPSSEIVWMTHPRWRGLVESSGLASEIRNVESRDLASVRAAISAIRASQWQSAIDYQGLWKSATLPFLGGVKRRIGFSSHTIREFGAPRQLPILVRDVNRRRLHPLVVENRHAEFANGVRRKSNPSLHAA